MADLEGGLEVYEEGGSGAEEGRRKGEAFEGGEEVGDAEVCIAACKSLASQNPVAWVSVDPPTSWSLSPNCESIFLGALVSVCPLGLDPTFQLLCVSVCQLGRCVSVHPRRLTRAMLEPLTVLVSVCLNECLALDELSLCPWVGLTERREAAGMMRRRWEKTGKM